MKTMKNLFFVAFAAMTIAACQKEMEDPNSVAKGTGKEVTFTASLDHVNTKTMINYEKDLNSGTFATRFLISSDRFVVNGVKSGEINKDNDSGTQISFSVQGVEGPYWAMSDHAFKSFDADTKTYTIQVNGTGKQQEYYKVSGGNQSTYYPSSDILASYSDEEEMTFKHMCAFLAITIDKDNSTVKDNIKNVYIRQGDGGNIAGTWYIKFDDNKEPYLEPHEKLSAALGYNCISQWSSNGVPQDNVMLVAIPAYNYESGLLVTIKDVNGKFASYRINAVETQLAGMGGYIIPFNPSFNPQSRTISSVEDWNEFAACINAAKKDWDLYTWIGDGTVKLEKDIIADELTPITAPFKYIFDGNGKTIKIKNAQMPLFDTVSGGEIRNLTLAGNMAGVVQVRNDYDTVLGSPFVGVLENGGKLVGCTNDMNVTVGTANKPIAAHIYASGLVSAMYAGTIDDCVNNGTIDVYVDVSASYHNVGVGGFVGDIRETSGNALIKNCINDESADITLTPKTVESGHSSYMEWCGLGGIAGVLRGPTPLTIDNCDNLADVTLSGSQIKDPQGFAARIIAVGGIIGLAAPVSSGLLADPASTDTRYDVSLLKCDNKGVVYNCATNYATTKQGKRLVVTGGLAGALIGGESKYAEIKTCTNTGMIITHDYTSEMNEIDENVIPSQRPNFCCVAGGLIGYGGYVNISDNCKVQCQIGNGKRQLLAWGGVIGYALRTFTIDAINIDVTGYFASYTAYAGNRAVVAVVPVTCNTTNMEITPNVDGSKISNSTIKCALYTLTTPLGSSTTATAAAKLDDLTLLDGNPYVNSLSDIRGNLVCGQGFTANDGVTIGDDTTDNNTYIVTTPAN